ncbi:hypothetical protein RKE29_30560, partial [Streptomyces sp. B1866]|uniref:hypothetical protein n=1 Tax=Streptomyces sp. B1866 TaxID=3075431 RepID=UPI0028922F01
LLALDENPHPQHPHTPTGTTLNLTLIQTLTQHTTTPTPLWLLTTHATATTPTEPLNHPLQALTWGLGRTTTLEHPDHQTRLIDIPTTLTQQTLHHLTTTLTTHHTQNEITIRPTGIHTRRLTHTPP